MLLTVDMMTKTDMLFLALVVCVCSVVLGFLTDLIMGKAGFGPVGNGLIIALGGIVGVHYRDVVFGPAAAQQSYAIAFSAIGAATLILIFFGMAKKFAKG
ncbi:MAG: hypothetical protein JNK46_06875 [Methylobacteriaceae bacterium]|nr:hypothetical protein [Methylobacteriaceae bacterium]